MRVLFHCSCQVSPGNIGEYKDRPLFDDLKSYNSDVYSLVYPGTYSEAGEFSLTNVTKAVKHALNDLKVFNKPILLVCYSFSTLFVAQCINKNDNVMSVLVFSPITDLKTSINEDFIETLNTIKTANPDVFNINIESFERQLNKPADEIHYKSFNKLNSLKVPVFFFLGGKDSNVKVKQVYQQINQLRIDQKLVYLVKEGEHRLDTLYSVNYVKKAILAVIVSFELRRMSNKILGVFLWGSTLNSELESESSDLDLIIIGDGFSYRVLERINNLKSKYEALSKVKIDLVYNSIKEIDSKKIIRRNRGILFTHELSSDYFPLFKNFIYNCKNYLYLEGFELPRLKDALALFKTKDVEVFNALEKSIALKKNNYEGLSKDFDIEVVSLTERLFSGYVSKTKNDWFFEESGKE